ncbi:TolC family protein [Gilvimarinus sp. SDUM040013]|uniref:TolC family protein n=1 Tax=Gilvimarinus gilvus TaxID=3058038 RepID=A0ABU4RWQ2_9GAMM|nr:TolC family protein [Gilvimarinus sp. SDUM040013]MDO3385309.1 TolC family protein [Gilvimarinus sp. SDUM040013]MDX6849292.1 TolC family protein [Gilvimarinus sp. SDUM040013]
MLQKGLSDPDVQRRFDAQQAQAKAQLDASGHWDNPSLEYSREDLGLQQGTSEETTIWLRQRINIAGVNGLEREAAKFSMTASEYSQKLERRDWMLRLRSEFYQTLAAQQKLSAVEGLKNRLQQLANAVQRRADKGDASRFDVLRINKELAVIGSDYSLANAEYHSHQSLLFALLNSPAEQLKGNLLPPTTSLPTVDVVQHPKLQALTAQQRSAETRAKAAQRSRWPELTVGVGRKEVTEPGLDLDGNTFAVGIEIPLFDRGQGHDQVAQSQAFQLQADKAILLRQLQAKTQSLKNALRSHYQSARELEKLNSRDASPSKASPSQESSLSYLAELSYQGGELSVMELLDAYQSDLATTQRLIDSSLQARRAHIQLQHMNGQ